MKKMKMTISYIKNNYKWHVWIECEHGRVELSGFRNKEEAIAVAEFYRENFLGGEMGSTGN